MHFSFFPCAFAPLRETSCACPHLRHLTFIAALIILLSGCSTQPAGTDHHVSLNSTLWVQTAAEYAGGTLQAYNSAKFRLDQALADENWTAALEQHVDYSHLPPAVMLDLDQTVLDTSTYNARIILQYGAHSSSKFRDWCEDFIAPAIPGAKDFIDHALARGVTVIYYSARPEMLRDCTANNLKALELPLNGQARLLLNDGTASAAKAQQRTDLAAQFRLLLLVGDNLDDFVNGSKADAVSRRALASQHAARWGKQWIILPNPMYGDWEFSLYGFDFGLPGTEQLKLKRTQLVP